MTQAGVARNRDGTHRLGNRQRKKMRFSDKAEDDQEETPPEKITRKIIQRAREQQIEEEADIAAVAWPSRASRDDKDDDDDEDDDLNPDAELDAVGEELAAEEDGYYEEGGNLQLSAQDERALGFFMGVRPRRTLADIIADKITQKAAMSNTAGEGGVSDPAVEPLPELPPKVIEVYKGVGKLLKTYKSGKLPKAFKIVPRLSNWEEILYVTEPENWTPVATREVRCELIEPT